MSQNTSGLTHVEHRCLPMEIPMSTQVKLPLYVSWRKLKDVLGWPYGRTHTNRLETEPEYYGDDPFPRRGKIGPHRNSHPITLLRWSLGLALLRNHNSHGTVRV
jgi:hypothetical protein